jgi:hypothetical protein
MKPTHFIVVTTFGALAACGAEAAHREGRRA